MTTQMGRSVQDTQRHVFARDYVPAASFPAVAPHSAVSAAVNQRRQVTLKRISDLKQSLASIVSSSRAASLLSLTGDGNEPEDGYVTAEPLRRHTFSSETIQRESPEAARPGTLPQPSQAVATLAAKPHLSDPPATLRHGGLGRERFLLDAQRRVERLTLENHELVRRCLELEEHIEDIRRGRGVPSSRQHEVPKATDDAADAEDRTRDSGEVRSPKELPFFTSNGKAPLRASPQSEGAHGGQLPDAIYGLLHRVSVCFPDLFRGIAPSTEESSASLAAPAVAADAEQDEDCPPSQPPFDDAVVLGLSEFGVCQALWRLERVLPGLVLTSRLGDLFTGSGGELLDYISALESEKLADYFKVLEITEKLQKTNTLLRSQEGVRQQQLDKANAEVEALRQQQNQLLDELAAERASKASSVAAADLEAAHEKRLSALAREHEEAIALLQARLAKESERTAAVEEQRRSLSEELESRQRAAAQRDADTAAQLKHLEGQLEEKRAEVEQQAAAIGLAVTQVEALGAAAVNTKARAEERWEQERAKITAASRQQCASKDEALAAKEEEVAKLRAEKEALAAQLERQAALPPAEVSANDDSTLLSTEKDEADEGGGGGVGGATSSDSADRELRKVRQSLQRMSSERAALKRRNERQSTVLAETQEKLSAAELQVTFLETELARLRMEEDLRCRAASSPRETQADRKNTSAATASTAVAGLLDFEGLESQPHSSLGGASADVYPPPVAAISASWLTTVHDVPAVACVTEAEEATRVHLEAGGWLYHVGLRMAEDAGLLAAEGASHGGGALRAWGRLLLQIQHCTQSHESPVFSHNAYAADCAQLSYSLLCAAGLVHGPSGGGGVVDGSATGRRGGVADPILWALVVAALCQFVGPSGRERGVDALGAGDAAPGGPSRWAAVEQILQHVSAANGRDTAAPSSFFGSFAGRAEEEALALETLRALLMYDDGPTDALFGCELNRLALRCCALAGDSEEQEGLGALETEAGLVSLGQLFLRLSRESVFLRSPVVWPPREEKGLWAPYGRTVLCPVSTPEGGEGEGERKGKAPEGAEAETTALGERLCLYLDGTVLPLALAASRVLSAACDGHDSAAGSALLASVVRARTALSAACGGVATPNGPLTSAHVDTLVKSFTASGALATEAELLRLYEENTVYRGYINKLLLSIEAK